MELCKAVVLMIVASLGHILLARASSAAEYPNDDLSGLAIPFDDEDEFISGFATSDPAPCCFPAQWQGIATAQVGTAKKGKGGEFVQSNTSLYVDSTNYRIAGQVGAGNATYNFVLLFNNSANSSTLYAYNKATQKCTVKPLKNTAWRKQCLPPNSTFVGKITLGPSTGGLSANLYRFNGRASEHGQRAVVAGTILVYPQAGTTCLPVLIEDRGLIRSRDEEENDISEDSSELEDKPRPRPKSTAFMVSEYFTSVQPSIKDPTVFNVPTYCKQGATLMFESEAEKQFPINLQRFIEFY